MAERLGAEVPVIVTSSATGAGLEELAGELLRRVSPRGGVRSERRGAGRAAPCGDRAERGEEDLAEHMVFRPRREGLSGRADAERERSRSGKGIERLLARYDIENEDAMAYLEERLRGSACWGRWRLRGFSPATRSRSGA